MNQRKLVLLLINDTTPTAVFVLLKTFFILQNDLDAPQNPPMCHDLARYGQVMKSFV